MPISYPIDLTLDLGAIAGIVGACTGIPALIISFFAFRYNTPKIIVEKAYLKLPSKNLLSNLVGRDDISSSFVDFDLEIIIRNRRGGAGSIDKPTLKIQFPNSNLHSILLFPVIKHRESIDNGQNSSTFRMLFTTEVRDGYAFNINAGQTIDDDVKYYLYGSKNLEGLKSYIENNQKAAYSLIYKDNNGKTKSFVPEIIQDEKTH